MSLDNNEKYIYLIIKENDIENTVIEAWKNPVEANDRILELNEKEIGGADYYVQSVILKGWDIDQIE